VRARFRTPLVLATIAIALGCYIGLVELHRSTTDQARATRGQLFGGLVRAQVTTIEIDRGTRGRVMLARGAGPRGDPVWRVLPQPGSAAGLAANGAVADLLDELDALEIEREATVDAAAAGLAPPAARLTITATSAPASPPLVLEVGALDVVGRGVFVRRGGEARTLVVGRRLRDLVDRDLVAFRERRLFAAGVVDGAQALSFAVAPAATLTLRKHDGFWLNEAGFFAARAAVAEALRTLAGLEASGFPDAGEAAPVGPVRWQLALSGGGEVRLAIGDPACAGEAGALQRRATLTFAAAGAAADPARQAICLDGTAVDKLWRQLAAADRPEGHLLMTEPSEADGILLSAGARHLNLRRDASVGWRVVEPKVDYAADARRIEDWLAGLARVALAAPTELPDRAETFAGAEDLRASPGARTLVLEGARRAEIVVSAPVRGKVRTARAGERGVASAPASLFADLDPDPSRFRSRTVLELARFDVTAIEIRAAQGHRRIARGAGGRWTDAPPLVAGDHAESEVDPASVDSLLGALAKLEAGRFYSDAEARGFEPDEVVDLTIQSGSAPPAHQRLELGTHCRARLEATPVFGLAALACEPLRAAVSALARRPPEADRSSP
jgi:Domain of unknown function (DUF4340)